LGYWNKLGSSLFPPHGMLFGMSRLTRYCKGYELPLTSGEIRRGLRMSLGRLYLHHRAYGLKKSSEALFEAWVCAPRVRSMQPGIACPSRGGIRLFPSHHWLRIRGVLGPVDIQPSVTKLVHFPPPEAKFSSNRSTIPQKIPLQEEKNVLRLARNAKCPQALVH